MPIFRQSIKSRRQKKANVNPEIRVRNLTEEEVGRIREIVDLEDIEEVRRLPHLKLTRRCANGKNERR